MKAEELLWSLEYFKKSRDHFRHLDYVEIQSVIMQYYDTNMKVEDIKHKFKLHKIENEFYQSLPTFISFIKCLNCDWPFEAIWYDRKSELRFVLKCNQCKSTISNKKLYWKMMNKLKNGMDESNRLKRNITLKEFVALYTIMKTCFNYETKLISSIDLFFTQIFGGWENGKRIFNSLIEKELLIPVRNKNNQLLGFRITEKLDSERNYDNAVNKLLDFPNNDLVRFDTNERMSLWYELALQEVQSYYLSKISDFGFNGEITRRNTETFRFLLKKLSVAQVWGVIYKSSKYIEKQDLQFNSLMEFEHYFCNNLEQYVMRALNEERTLVNYHRPIEIGINLMANTYFYEVLCINSLYYTETPSSSLLT